MRLKRATLEELELPLAEPFVTSFGAQRRRRVLFVTVEERGGEVGVGECVAALDPGYSEETVATARWMIQHHLLPALSGGAEVDVRAVPRRFDLWRGHRMAKAAVEMALWDLHGRLSGRSLASALGGRRSRVSVGVSVGIQPTVDALVHRVGRYLDDGYRRVKLKVRPGWDERAVGAVRREYPDVPLWVDANQAYRPSALPEILRWARRFHVEQVEQPFPERSVAAHAALVARAPFRVCLDESVVDSAALEDAITRRALTSLNVKPGRVGGHGASCGLARQAARASLPAWVGGMLETGIGRAHAVALAARAEFTLPADLSASRRYYLRDLIDPPFELGPGSTLAVPRGPGIGVAVDERRWVGAVRHRSVHRL